jgi:hypothetical protein
MSQRDAEGPEEDGPRCRNRRRYGPMTGLLAAPRVPRVGRQRRLNAVLSFFLLCQRPESRIVQSQRLASAAITHCFKEVGRAVRYCHPPLLV